MILTTTPHVDGRRIKAYLGIVAAEAVVGINLVLDVLASIADVAGGRAAYEEELAGAREAVLEQLAARARRLGADAVVGIDFDFAPLRDGMLVVTAAGTAVQLE